MNNPDRLKAMKAAYLEVINPGLVDPMDEAKLQKVIAEDPSYAITQNWVETGRRWDVPKHAWRVCHCGKTYVWVTPEHAEDLTRFVLLTLNLASFEFGTPKPKPPKIGPNIATPNAEDSTTTSDPFPPRLYDQPPAVNPGLFFVPRPGGRWSSVRARETRRRPQKPGYEKMTSKPPSGHPPLKSPFGHARHLFLWHGSRAMRLCSDFRVSRMFNWLSLRLRHSLCDRRMCRWLRHPWQRWEAGRNRPEVECAEEDVGSFGGDLNLPPGVVGLRPHVDEGAVKDDPEGIANTADLDRVPFAGRFLPDRAGGCAGIVARHMVEGPKARMRVPGPNSRDGAPGL